MAGGAAALIVIATTIAVAWVFSSNDDHGPDRNNAWVEVKRVRSGDTIIVNSNEKVRYAGIRAPFRNELLFEEAVRRNEKLVAGKEVRLRFDERERDKKGRLDAYVFVDNLFVNAALVREGLAYVRLTTTTQRFADPLLAAQSEARRGKRGIWSRQSDSSGAGFMADPKYGNFHATGCDELEKIDPRRVVILAGKREAFDRGFAPCNKCKP